MEYERLLKEVIGKFNMNFKVVVKSHKRPIDSCIRLAVLATQVEHLNGVADGMRKRFDDLESRLNRTLDLLGAIKSGIETVIRRQGDDTSRIKRV